MTLHSPYVDGQSAADVNFLQSIWQYLDVNITVEVCLDVMVYVVVGEQ